MQKMCFVKNIISSLLALRVSQYLANLSIFDTKLNLFEELYN